MVVKLRPYYLDHYYRLCRQSFYRIASLRVVCYQRLAAQDRDLSSDVHHWLQLRIIMLSEYQVGWQADGHAWH